ncbi:MAG: biopolymer transporter ExbD [Nitrospinae bacterium]|nr:biopolymer transporter ExbD [Nitrospinota bacterium]
MAYRPSKRRRHSISDTDLNLTPVMNLFMVIIPFLLLTAVFAKTAIIDAYLPQESGNGGGSQTAAPKILIVKATEKGIELGGIGEGIFIPMLEGNLNYKQLSIELARLKNSHPDKEDAVLLFPPQIAYDHVVQIMDAARETTGENGIKKTLFPIISLGENK